MNLNKSKVSISSFKLHHEYLNWVEYTSELFSIEQEEENKKIINNILPKNFLEDLLLLMIIVYSITCDYELWLHYT
tara:strand:- start:381 stop:608 length:228 start_codon:yes stop_codon:yes gene_type:complete